jgi:O-antigen/teichoic acid export membrane protein
MCQQFWPCNAVPPEYFWLMPIVMPLLAIILLGVPTANILHRAGRSRWWTLIAFIPLLNLIGLWVFAFSRWPEVDRLSS